MIGYFKAVLIPQISGCRGSFSFVYFYRAAFCERYTRLYINANITTFFIVEDVGPLRYRGHFVDSSVYADYKCFAPLKYKSTGKASADHPYGVAITMGFTVRILDDFNYEQMESFKIYFKASSRSTPSLSASIYAASSYNFDGNYQISCGMRNFRRDLYYGPVSWSTGSWESGTIYNTPDLMEIVRPLFDRGTLVWRKYFFIIFEWTSSPGSTISVNLQSKNPYYIFLYKDNSPGLLISSYLMLSYLSLLDKSGKIFRISTLIEKF